MFSQLTSSPVEDPEIVVVMARNVEPFGGHERLSSGLQSVMHYVGALFFAVLNFHVYHQLLTEPIEPRPRLNLAVFLIVLLASNDGLERRGIRLAAPNMRACYLEIGFVVLDGEDRLTGRIDFQAALRQ